MPFHPDALTGKPECSTIDVRFSAPYDLPYRWLLQSDKWLPVLFRYFKDSFLLSPWRMCIHIIYRILQSQAPLARLWASTKIRAMVEEAIETGHVDKLKLALFVALSGMLSTGFRSVKLFL